jgi:predicted RNase H-like HicB family nuclease
VKEEYVYPAVISNAYDGGKLWVANFPGLKGCWVEGSNRDEVIKEAPKILREYLGYFKKNNLRLPEPMGIKTLERAGIGEVIEIKCKL